MNVPFIWRDMYRYGGSGGSPLDGVVWGFFLPVLAPLHWGSIGFYYTIMAIAGLVTAWFASARSGPEGAFTGPFSNK